MENAVEFALQRSSALSGLQRGCAFPTAYAVGFILAPLCGCINDGVLKLFAGFYVATREVQHFFVEAAYAAAAFFATKVWYSCT